MGFLEQSSSSIDDCTQFTYSTWINFLDTIDQPDDDAMWSMLLQFGNTDDRGNDSGIGVKVDGSVNVLLYGSRFLFLGANYGGWWGGDGTDNYEGGSPDVNEFGDPAYTNPPNTTRTGIAALWLCDWAPLTTGFNLGPVPSFPSPVFFDSTPGWRLPYLRFHTQAGALVSGWNHLFIAADVTTGFVNRSTWTPGVRPILVGQDPVTPYTPPTEPARLYSPAHIYITGASGCVYEDGHSGEIYGKADLRGGEPTKGPYANTSSSGFLVNNPEGRDGALVEGYPVCLPGRYPVTDPNSLSLFVDHGSARKVFAYTQIWFNQFIDPTNPDNLGQFFTRKTINGVPRIVPPTNKNRAQDAFGPSDIWCRRDKAGHLRYQVNAGIGGDFSESGTAVADYFPGPGQ